MLKRVLKPLSYDKGWLSFRYLAQNPSFKRLRSKCFIDPSSGWFKKQKSFSGLHEFCNLFFSIVESFLLATETTERKKRTKKEYLRTKSFSLSYDREKTKSFFISFLSSELLLRSCRHRWSLQYVRMCTVTHEYSGKRLAYHRWVKGVFLKRPRKHVGGKDYMII